MEEWLKSSEDWQKEIPYPKVLDPDGWDRSNYEYSWKEELISLSEYIRRRFLSTCMYKIE